MVLDQQGDSVTITKKRYEELLAYAHKLECLEAAGVDNWDGYDYAIQMMFGDKE